MGEVRLSRLRRESRLSGYDKIADVRASCHLASMEPLTHLERAALGAIFSEMTSDQSILATGELDNASVLSRENTGGGFFSMLQINTTKIGQGSRHLGDNVWINVEGLNYGLGMILHLKDELTAMLEGYAVGPEDTSEIAFSEVGFAVAVEPGPLTTNGS